MKYFNFKSFRMIGIPAAIFRFRKEEKNGKHFCHLLSAAETELTDGGSWGANGGGGGGVSVELVPDELI
jgi:hypothetical protein